MSLPLASASSLLRNLRANFAPASQRYLFLLSHMRSYSSLLAHLLGGCSEIDGYGETQLKYKASTDLWRLRLEIRRSTGVPNNGRWLLDKILHNYVCAPDRLLAPERTRALIFLRRPEPSIRSIMTLARIKSPGADLNNPQLACDYYVSRLHRLRTDGQRLGERAFYFDAEAVIRRPDELLAALTIWLELDKPLQREYVVSRRTGENGFGDPLNNIRSGQILDASHSTIDNDLVLTGPLFKEAEAAYQRCRDILLRECSSTASSVCADS
jgi:hypothetical protein